MKEALLQFDIVEFGLVRKFVPNCVMFGWKMSGSGEVNIKLLCLTNYTQSFESVSTVFWFLKTCDENER